MKKITSLFALTIALTKADPIQLPVYSTFDGDADGWVSSSTAFQHYPQAGNPDGCIGLEDVGSDGNWAIAPAKFLGDWTALNERGAVFFDHKVFDPGTGVLESYGYQVRISGPNGAQATWYGPTPTGATPWRSMRVPIRESAWTLSEGTNWSQLLRNVTKFEVKMEMFNNSGGTSNDKDALDNIGLAIVDQGCNLAIQMRPTLRFQTVAGRIYVIETSRDNVTFTRLSTIQGTGNFVTYTDLRQLPKRQFYRLVCPQ